MIDYSKSSIYKIVPKTDYDNVLYIGCTTRSLNRRMSGHRYSSKSQPCLFHQWVLANGGWNSVEIVLVETYTCASKEELFKREIYWIEKLKPKLNCTNPINPWSSTTSFGRKYPLLKPDLALLSPSNKNQ